MRARQHHMDVTAVAPISQANRRNHNRNHYLACKSPNKIAASWTKRSPPRLRPLLECGHHVMHGEHRCPPRCTSRAQAALHGQKRCRMASRCAALPHGARAIFRTTKALFAFARVCTLVPPSRHAFGVTPRPPPTTAAASPMRPATRGPKPGRSNRSAV